MKTVLEGLRAPLRHSTIGELGPLSLRRSFRASYTQFRPVPLISSPSISPFSVSRLLLNTAFHVQPRPFHTTSKLKSEDPRTTKPPQYPEAEWARVNDEYEEKIRQKSWFFRPLYRLMGHPKFFAANVTGQFVLVATLIGAWIYIWFFMGYAPKPVPKDGTGRELTEEEIQEMETIENYLHSHPVVHAIRSQKYLIESRPHWSIPDKDIPHNLTGGTLRGLGRVSVAPIAFHDGEGKEFYAVLHVGKDICGQKATVHDGIIAMILDESLARCCFPALPNRIGVTANLNVDFREPIPADSYLLVKAKTVRLEGRKAWVEGSIESLGTIHQEKRPTLYAEGKGLFIEPKYAAIMKRIMLS